MQELETRLVPSVAVSANDFLNSLGVNTHFDQGAENPALAEASLTYTGIRNIRDGGRYIPTLIGVHNATGVMVDLLSSPDTIISRLEPLAAAGALLAAEGPNEPNNFPVTYNGQSSAGTKLTTTTAATINDSAWFDTSYHNNGASTQSYGPVGFTFASTTAFVTGHTTLGALRNNLTGWVGFKFTVGSSPITVNQLGRWVVSGNGGTHTVRLVRASDQAVLGSVAVATAGAPANAFKYVALGTPITLTAHTAYYVMSQETSGGDQWYDGVQNFLPVAQFQRDLYAAVQADPNLTGIPVFASSEAGGSEPNNVGQQFLTIPSGAGTLMPDGTVYADYANPHNYVAGNGQTHILDNHAWNAESPGPQVGPWDGMHAEYGVTWNKHFGGYSDSQLVTLPKVTTETGWATQGTNALSEDQQGRLYLNLYLDAFARGWSYTFIYELRDGGGWGIDHSDYTPKLSATYLHNLTTILADNVSIAPDSLNYSIPSEPATVHDLLLEKSNGTFELAVWDERASSSDNVTVNLGSTYGTVNLYDPTVDSAATQALSNVSSVALTLGDHPVIIEIPSLVVGDPGFEMPSVGIGPTAYQYNPTGVPWTYTGNAGVTGNGSDFTSGNPAAPEGTQVAFLEDQGPTVSQGVNFPAGTYSLSFSAAQGAYNASSQTFQVLLDGNSVGTFMPGSINYDAFTTSSFAVAAGAHTISFVGLDPDGLENTAFLDQVVINQGTSIVGDPGFKTPSVGIGSSAYQYHATDSAWTFLASTGVAGNGNDFASGNPGAPQSTQVTFLQREDSAFGQRGSFTAGIDSLSFSAVPGAHSARSQTFQVLLDGNSVGTFTPGSPTDDAFTTSTFRVAAGAHTIGIVGLDPDEPDNTAVLDQVQLSW